MARTLLEIPISTILVVGSLINGLDLPAGAAGKADIGHINRLAARMSHRQTGAQMKTTRLVMKTAICAVTALGASLCYAPKAFAAWRSAIARYTSIGTVDFSSLGGLNTRAYFSVLTTGQDKIVAAGIFTPDSGGTQPLVVRYTENGTPDSSFGWLGVSTFNLPGPGSDQEQAAAIAYYGSGKYVLNCSRGDGTSFVVRLNSNGSVDTSFGFAGFASPFSEATGPVAIKKALDGSDSTLVLSQSLADRTPRVARLSGQGVTFMSVAPKVGDSAFNPWDLAVDRNGNILIAGHVSTPNKTVMAAMRLTMVGLPDPGFGKGGQVTADFGYTNQIATGIAIDWLDHIVLVGEPWNSVNKSILLKARFSGAGVADPGGLSSVTFTNTGEVSPIPLNFWRIAIGPSDGKYYVGGTVIQDATLASGWGAARWLSDGSALDNSFGDHGRVMSFSATDIALSSAVAVDSSNRLTIVGQDFPQ